MSPESDPTSVMGRRIGAVAIDGAIAFVPAVAVFLGNITTKSLQEREDLGFRITDAETFCEEYMEQGDGGNFCFTDGDDVHYTENGLLSAGLVLYGIAIALHVILQSITGASLGKLATGLRVVDEHGNKAGFGRNLVRWLLWIVDSLPAFGLVGLITSLTTTGHRRVGDMVAKTHVVAKRSVGQPLGVGHHAIAGPATPAAPSARPGPQWDEARGTYIQWDPQAQAWMQWDEAAKRWDPIPAAAPAIPPPPPAAPPPPPPPPPS
jgi:hypothetical protein